MIWGQSCLSRLELQFCAACGPEYPCLVVLLRLDGSIVARSIMLSFCGALSNVSHAT